ncbi:MAG: hypothetical protein H6718_04470 [Polyangiaceae bacterium]|nr:hypothetical protein [Polyangiaceae bacterium]
MSSPRTAQGSARTAACLAALLALSACGPRFDVSSDVRDSKVSVFVKRAKAGDQVSVQGIEGATATVSASGYATIEIPADKVGQGKHELSVELIRGDKHKTKKLSVDVPASAVAPFLRIMGCTIDMEHGSAKLTSKANFAGAEKRCSVTSAGALELRLEANSDAEVTLGGATATIGADGKGTGSVPLTSVLEKLSLRGVGDSSVSGEFPLKLQATSARGGGSVDFPLEVELKLEAIRKSLFQAVLELDAGKAASWPRSAHDGKPRGVVFAAKAHPVKVDGKEQTVRASSFSRVLVAGEDHKANELDWFAVATPSDVTKRGACTGYRTISGVGGVRNTGFVMGFDVKVYDHSGKEVASKSFEKPKKTRCPQYLSGSAGKTTILVWAPDKQDVQKWLDSLVK